MTTDQPSLSKIFLISDYWVVENCLETNCFTKNIVDIHLDIKCVQTYWSIGALASEKGKANLFKKEVF